VLSCQEYKKQQKIQNMTTNYLHPTLDSETQADETRDGCTVQGALSSSQLYPEGRFAPSLSLVANNKQVCMPSCGFLPVCDTL
jgi:hypothetical protein